MTKFAKPEIPWDHLDSKDFNQYIQGCFFKVDKGNGKPFWKKINHPSDFNGLNVDFSFPESGIYNFKNEVIGFFRTTYRQWKRGISEGTSLFWSPFESYHGQPKFKMDIPWSNFIISSNHLGSLFSSKFISFNAALDSVLKEKAMARAISPRFFISVGANKPHPLLWQWSKPIGWIEKGEKVVLTIPHLLSDVKEILPKTKMLCLSEKGENS